MKSINAKINLINHLIIRIILIIRYYCIINMNNNLIFINHVKLLL